MAPTRPDPIAALTGIKTGTRTGAPQPSGISLPGGGEKFWTDGTVQNWPGNTFICHVPQASAAHAAIRELQEQVKMSPFARFYTYLPPSSFHMTIFQGVSPSTRDDDLWPKGVSGRPSRDALTAHMLAQTEALRFAPPRARMVDLYCANSLTMAGADEAEEARLREIRRQILDATGLTLPGFDDYVFHVTLSYLVTHVSPATAREIVDFSAQLSDRYRDAVGTVNLGPVEFCNFETMHHFEPLKALV